MPGRTQFFLYIAIATLGGQLTAEQFFPLDHEGVTCLSITQVWRDSTGNYTIRRPALLEREDRTLVPGDVPDDAITADHKSVVTPPLNNYKFLPLFYGQTKHAELTEKFLRDHVLSAEIFALRRVAKGSVAPLSAENSMSWDPGRR